MDSLERARLTAELQLRLKENLRDARGRAERRAAVAETLLEWRREQAKRGSGASEPEVSDQE